MTIVGYTTGVFDLFHIGHVNLLRNSRALCDRLVVGVTTDEIMLDYKGKTPVIPFVERIEVVRACRYVDCAIPQVAISKLEAHDKLKFDVLFVGDDWFASDSWQEMELELQNRGVSVRYFPYTTGTSSTLINETLVRLRDESQRSHETRKP